MQSTVNRIMYCIVDEVIGKYRKGTRFHYKFDSINPVIKNNPFDFQGPNVG